MRPRTAPLTAALLLFPGLAAAQGMPGMHAAQHWYALVELPALVIAIVFGFLTARALRGGRFGSGMTLIAWGFLVMAVGHLHMQLEAIFGFNIFSFALGSAGGQAAWLAALLVTWTLTGLGFYRLYHASSRV
jgi:hypothetical protein